MRIAIPDEQGVGGQVERRVGLAPREVGALVRSGHAVVVQTGAGEGAGFADAEYEEAGARVVHRRAEVLIGAELVLCLGWLHPDEVGLLDAGAQVLSLGWLEMAPPAVRRAFQEAGVRYRSAHGFQDDTGAWPVIAAMSRICGMLAPQIAARMLESTGPGRVGVLLGRLPGVAPAEVAILGGGTLGFHAARAFAGIGASVHLLDPDPARLEAIADALPPNVITMHSTPSTIARSLSFANVLIGAARVPDQRAPLLVRETQVRQMRQGSAILDFSISEGGCVETSRPIASPDDVYAVHGVQHFAMPNVASLVARTATKQLSQTLLPFVRQIAGGAA
ncbi:MAG: alanine dehydrogenase [Alphaproteobacteria bacterium]|nr:alanine dehydrogenase [Alphaproteobacteria bacterium]